MRLFAQIKTTNKTVVFFFRKHNSTTYPWIHLFLSGDRTPLPTPVINFFISYIIPTCGQTMILFFLRSGQAKTPIWNPNLPSYFLMGMRSPWRSVFEKTSIVRLLDSGRKIPDAAAQINCGVCSWKLKDYNVLVVSIYKIYQK